MADADRDFDRLYRAEGERLWRSVLLFTGNREVASDAVAEAFAQLIARGDAVRSPAAWVWRAAFRIAAGEMGRMRSARLVLADEPYEIPEPLVDLLSALAGLSPNQRAAVILHDYRGYSYREVAEILGSTPSAVGVHLHRAHRRLRRALEVRHG